jgi:hypothetical protein
MSVLRDDDGHERRAVGLRDRRDARGVAGSTVYVGTAGNALAGLREA